MKFLSIVLVLLITGDIAAQVPAPQGALATDDSDYQLFEPVIVTASVHNSDSERHAYGIPSPGVPASSIHFELTYPDSFTVYHPQFSFGSSRELVSPGRIITYGPGVSVERTFNALLSWSPWVAAGDYILRMVNTSPDGSGGSIETVLDAVTFSVSLPLGVDSSLVNLSQGLATAAFAGHGLIPDLDSKLDSVANLGGLPSSMAEFMSFAYVVSAYVDAGGLLTSEAQSRYTSFKSEYPSSVYHLPGVPLNEFLDRRGEAEVPHDSSRVARVKVFLEGAYSTNGDSLRTGIPVPLREPYEVEPWNHLSYPESDLSEAGLSSQLPQVVDYVLVGVVDDTAGTMVDMRATQLFSDGTAWAPFVNLPSGEYRLVVEHRNHLAVASDTLVDFTSGFAVHDFTTGHAYGINPQETITSGQDTVYAMFAGDNSADGQITATDFNKWLAQTKAAAAGYIESDHNLDAQSTAPDFNHWLNNTKKAAASPHWVIGTLFPNVPANAPWAGGGSEAVPKVAITEDDIRVRYRLTGSSANGFVNTYIDFKQDTGGSEVDTLGSATFDVYYNDDQVAFDYASHYVDLLEAGYTVEIAESVNEHGSFMRADIYTWNPDTVSYDIRSDWENVLRFNFDATGGQITDHGLGMNLATMDVRLVSDGDFKKASALVPWWADGGFTY